MPNIDMKRLASGAVLCFVMRSLGLSLPGNLNNVKFSGTNLLLNPHKVCGGKVADSSQTLTFADADSYSCVGQDFQLDWDTDVDEDGLDAQRFGGSFGHSC